VESRRRPVPLGLAVWRCEGVLCKSQRLQRIVFTVSRHRRSSRSHGLVEESRGEGAKQSGFRSNLVARRRSGLRRPPRENGQNTGARPPRAHLSTQQHAQSCGRLAKRSYIKNRKKLAAMIASPSDNADLFSEGWEEVLEREAQLSSTVLHVNGVKEVRWKHRGGIWMWML